MGVAVMDVNTGRIRAIANLGRNKDGDYKERRNYAIWEAHEPGSTFKTMALLAALEDRKIDTSDVFDTGNGVWKTYGKSVRDSKRGGYGKISMAKALRVSSNTAFAKMITSSYQDQPEQFVNRLRNFKLHEPLGIPIIGEGTPKIRYLVIRNGLLFRLLGCHMATR